MNWQTALLSSAIICIMTACTASQKNHLAAQNNGTTSANALYDTIAHLDSVLFDGFNNRDLDKQKEIFSTDVEFYHDKGGLTHYTQVIESLKKLFEQNNGLKRTLIPGSLEVYAINGYGAIEVGAHRFCHQENGKDDCGTFKFVHVWQRGPNSWKLTRVISYDH